MAISITHDDKNDCIVIKVTGAIDYEDILSLREELLNHPLFRQNINQLFDCTEGELNLTTGDLQRIAADYGEVADKLGHNRKLALVVSRDLDFGMMRQYEAFFYAGPDVDIRAHRSVIEAQIWLDSE